MQHTDILKSIVVGSNVVGRIKDVKVFENIKCYINVLLWRRAGRGERIENNPLPSPNSLISSSLLMLELRSL